MHQITWKDNQTKLEDSKFHCII